MADNAYVMLLLGVAYMVKLGWDRWLLHKELMAGKRRPEEGPE